MAHIAGDRPPRLPVFDATLARLSARIARLVKPELAASLAAALEHHFNGQLLPEMHQRVEAVAARELAARVGAILAGEVPERVEAIRQRVSEPAQPPDSLASRTRS